MNFRELVRDLTKRLGLAEAIEVDADDRFTFEVDGAGVVVQGMDESSSLALVADLGRPPPERLEALYLELLKANHPSRGTPGVTFSVNPETQAVALHRILSLNDQTAESFEREIGRFISVLLDWRTKVREFRADESPASSVSDDGLFVRV